MNLFIKNIKQLVTVASGGKRWKTGLAMNDLGVIEHAAVFIRDGAFAWIGKEEEWNQTIPPDVDVLDADGAVALPGFVDAHTHILFAGSCEEYFAEGHLSGPSEDHLRIFETNRANIVRTTRAASKKEIKKSARAILNAMMRLGSTTVEVKTGFGLTERDELKLTEVAHELTEEHFLDIVPTYYGASAVPPEFQGNESGYIDILCSRQLPYLAKRGIVSWCDVNCDAGGFSLDQARTILQTAQSLGMKVKLHAGRFASMGAVDLAAEFCAVSADHLNGATALDIATLVSSKCVATLMPCVSFAAGEAIPPVRAMIQAGLPLALATHADPCTALCFSMPMAMTIACRQWGMTAEEAITATTLNAAAALGCSETIGSIEEGKQADIVLWNIPHYRSLLYQFGNQTAWKVIKRGTYLDY